MNRMDKQTLGKKRCQRPGCNAPCQRKYCPPCSAEVADEREAERKGKRDHERNARKKLLQALDANR